MTLPAGVTPGSMGRLGTMKQKSPFGGWLGIAPVKRTLLQVFPPSQSPKGLFVMSIAAMVNVWQSDDTKGGERLVLLALADSANDDGYCWPSIAHLAKKCNMSPQAVRRFLARLELAHKIKRIFRPGHSNYFKVGVVPLSEVRGTPPRSERTPLPEVRGRTQKNPQRTKRVVPQIFDNSHLGEDGYINFKAGER